MSRSRYTPLGLERGRDTRDRRLLLSTRRPCEDNQHGPSPLILAILVVGVCTSWCPGHESRNGSRSPGPFPDMHLREAHTYGGSSRHLMTGEGGCSGCTNPHTWILIHGVVGGIQVLNKHTTRATHLYASRAVLQRGPSVDIPRDVGDGLSR